MSGRSSDEQYEDFSVSGNAISDESKTGIKVYARIRKRFPTWEDAIALTYGDSTVSNVGHHYHTRMKTTRFFDKVFGWNADNNQIFKEMVLPMLDNVVEGYPSVLIAYGQTGAGKTYSLLGAGSKQPGLLPQALAWLLEKDDNKQVILKGIEVYGLSSIKVAFYDLMDKVNANPDWSNKSPLKYLQDTKSIIIKDPEECTRIVINAHHSSHFAPTARNPQSSRGHTAFVASIRVDNRKTSFVVVDLAGSEGMDAIDCESLRRRPKQFELRKMEAGTIKAGLGEMRNMVNELRRRKLESRKGTGLRKLLHSYITGNTILAFLFAIAPSKMHTAATENTLRVADMTSQIEKHVERTLKGELTPLEMISKLKAQLAVKNMENQKLKEQLTSLREVLRDKMQTNIDTKDSQIKGLHERNAMLERTIETMKRQQESLMEKEIITLTSQNHTLLEKNQRQKEMIDNHKNELAAIKDEYEAKIHDKEIQIQTIQSELEETEVFTGVTVQSSQPVISSGEEVPEACYDMRKESCLSQYEELQMERAVEEAFNGAEKNQRGMIWETFQDARGGIYNFLSPRNIGSLVRNATDNVLKKMYSPRYEDADTSETKDSSSIYDERKEVLEDPDLVLQRGSSSSIGPSWSRSRSSARISQMRKLMRSPYKY